MSEEPKPETGADNPPPEPAKPESAESEKEQVGEFITRHILEKDTVFFEG